MRRSTLLTVGVVTAMMALATESVAQQPAGAPPAAPPSGSAAPPGTPAPGGQPGASPWFQGQPPQGQPPQGQPQPGYPQQGQPQQGYLQQGQPQPGYPQQGQPQQGYPQQGQPPPGYAQPGYPQQGYPQQGYPQQQQQPWGPPPAPPPPDRASDEQDERRAPRRRQPAARLPWSEGDPVPAGYMVKTRPRVGLLVSGAVLFGVSYLPSLGIAATVDEDDELLPLAIPIAGPFVTMGTADAEDSGLFWLAVDGVMQTTGATLFIASFVAEQSYLRRVADAPSTTPSLAVGPGSVAVRGAF